MQRRARWPWLLALPLAGLAVPAAGQSEDKDLDLIPSAVVTPPVPPSAPGSTDFEGNFYVEDAAALISRRDQVGPALGITVGPDWINRTFLDGRFVYRPFSELTATVSDRLNLQAEDDRDFPTHGSLRDDFREGFLTWSPDSESFFDIGRINVRNGAAYGFNPTDFFKTRSVVDEVSVDPNVLRDNRLGTVMIRAQQLFPDGAVSVLYAPKLEQPSAIDTTDPAAFTGNFDHTNATGRFLLQGNYDLAPDFSPQLLLYHEGNTWQYGANITHGLGTQTTLYLEYAGGRRNSLIDQGISYGVATGTLPAVVQDLFPDDRHKSFESDLATGLTYTTPSKLTFTLEYEYHQTGLSGPDLLQAFGGPGAVPFRTDSLSFVRLYALDQQQPLGQQTAFLRMEWDDAFVRDLTVAGLSTVNLYDGSLLGQATIDYRVTERLGAELLAEAAPGRSRSEFGTDPQAALLQLSISYRF
jgi:hypothetical protein